MRHAATYLNAQDVINAASSMGLAMTEEDGEAFLVEYEDMIRDEMTGAGEDFVEVLLRDTLGNNGDHDEDRGRHAQAEEQRKS